MAKKTTLFTSECVTMGHPDKVADQISDAILDSIIGQDPRAHVACETMVSTGMAIVAGEIRTECYVDIPDIVRQTIKDIGYDDPRIGFDWEAVAVISSIKKQSEDIAIGVDKSKRHEQGAGDQGMMFGFACDETPEFMPLPIMLARQLCNRLAECREKKILPYLKSDGKSQVTVQYEGGRPVCVTAVVVSTQHMEKVSNTKLRKDILDKVIKKVIPKKLLKPGVKFHINPTGRFVQGGPHADTGLTGRKIIVDTYGGMGRHGGGAFSGKDPSKVDRSAAYMARHIAKNIVAAGLASKCEIELSYAIGVAHPISVLVETFGTNSAPENLIEKLVVDHFPLTPEGIIKYLDLLKPVYLNTARYGHFGIENKGYTWESTKMAPKLRRAAGLPAKK